jgi:hypothetical protein
MATSDGDPWLRPLAETGYAIVPAVFPPHEVDALLRHLNDAVAVAATTAGVMRSQRGTVYAARNLLALCPDLATRWRRPPLTELLAAVLGPEYGLVRVLFFDKPPDRTWALPWHKDLTIAVRDNSRRSAHFSKPTRKAGVPHVEASREVLEAMLTLRIHLDDVTEENGPLGVIPGSHRSGKALDIGAVPPRSILVSRGDVLVMRPLLAHASNSSLPDTCRHRRILHLEFAGRRELPDGYAWHDFIPASRER